MWIMIKVTELYRIVDMHTVNDNHEVKVLYSGINQKVIDIYDRLEDATRELIARTVFGTMAPCFVTKTYFVIEKFERDDSEGSKKA